MSPSYSYPFSPVEKLLLSFRRSTAAAALVAMVAATTGAFAYNGTSAGYIANTTVSITDGKDFVNQGGNLLYVIKVTENAGPARYMDIYMTLPSYANAVYPDGGGRVVGNHVIWDNLSLSQGEEKIFTIQVNLGQNIPENTVLSASVQADHAVASDTTTVRAGNPNSSFRISITDNKTAVYPGQNLSYIITVKNTSVSDVTTDVSANVSALNAVTSFSPTATLNYPTITWKNVTFQPGETKTFTFDAAMRKRVSPYTAARVVARVGSLTATDTTTALSLHGDPVFMTSTNLNSSSSITTSSSASSSHAKSVLFRNVADAGDVVPGGTIRYTMYVQNVLLNVIHDAVVTERFDPTQVTVVNAGNGTVLSPGVIQWTLPVLQPGQVWNTSYTLKVASNLKNGTEINSVATISGTDVAFATLNEKAMVTTTSVVGTLPTTGGAFDLLFAFLTTPLAVAGAALQRKLS